LYVAIPLSFSQTNDFQVPLKQEEVSRVVAWAYFPAHQIRVHLQYLGHPIPNDPLYSPEPIWGPNPGKGGVDLVIQPDTPHLASAIASRVVNEGPSEKDDLVKIAEKIDLEDRMYSNIDLTSPIRLSRQAREVIAKLRKARDEQEDWVK
jgi:hypothetical protein